MDLITLRAGRAGVVLAPAAGGSVARYWIDRGRASWELLRSSAASRPTDPFECAAFALVPYSNRIRAGRFSFGRRDVRLPLNRPPERHSIHGLGWSMAWRPLDVRERPWNSDMMPAHGRGPSAPRSTSSSSPRA
jgi:aldose 1-epimerase